MTDPFDPKQFKETVGLKEEITDIVEGIHARYSEENFKKLRIKKGRVLRFDYEGSKTTTLTKNHHSAEIAKSQ
jgi:hypothetical protein